jgi:hypothetical protein
VAGLDEHIIGMRCVKRAQFGTDYQCTRYLDLFENIERFYSELFGQRRKERGYRPPISAPLEKAPDIEQTKPVSKIALLLAKRKALENS